jgi:hypothetical protein
MAIAGESKEAGLLRTLPIRNAGDPALVFSNNSGGHPVALISGAKPSKPATRPDSDVEQTSKWLSRVLGAGSLSSVGAAVKNIITTAMAQTPPTSQSRNQLPMIENLPLFSDAFPLAVEDERRKAKEFRKSRRDAISLPSGVTLLDVVTMRSHASLQSYVGYNSETRRDHAELWRTLTTVVSTQAESSEPVIHELEGDIPITASEASRRQLEEKEIMIARERRYNGIDLGPSPPYALDDQYEAAAPPPSPVAQSPLEDYGWEFGHREFNKIVPSLLLVVGPLGHGSIGVVEEVRVSVAHPSFVRKRVQLPYHNRQQRLEIIKQEAKALQGLSHCHIVRIIGSYQDGVQTGKQFYSLLMSPVGDRDLKTFLEMVGESSVAGRPEEVKQELGWLRKWFKCLASALAYMHSQGIRHQDIKPSNIIHRGEKIFFTDFSSASHFDVGHTTSTENPARSTLMYSAPETIGLGETFTRHGRGTDVFALGTVFCEMLTVYRNRSVSQFHEYFLERNSLANSLHPLSAFTRNLLVYAQNTDCIYDWFGEEDTFYAECIRPMLNRSRDDRPDASTAASTIRKSFIDPITCSCDLAVLE